MELKSGEQYKYYMENDFLSQDSNFDIQQFHQHQKSREDLLKKLKLPVALFKDARLLEFGPDTGENSLVFSNWGAQLTLVEPNPKSIQRLKEYFLMFMADKQLPNICQTTFEEFDASKQFDFLVAEGFIYTILPTEMWLSKFYNLLKPGGIALITCLESAGCLIELVTQLIYRFYASKAGRHSKELAWQLFETKWNSIPHSRPFASWYMDVLISPFMRSKYLCSAEELINKAFKVGLGIYSSIPSYEDSLYLEWHRKPLLLTEQYERMNKHIERSKLSYMVGRKCFYVGSDDDAKLVNNSIAQLVRLVDSQLDDINKDMLLDCENIVADLKHKVKAGHFYSDSDPSNICKILEMLQDIFQLLGQDSAKKLIEYCNHNPTFIKEWGLPTHLITFQRLLHK